MPLMHNADDKKGPAHRPQGKKTPLSDIKAKKSSGDDHYDVGGTKTAHAYYTGGFGWAGENTNEPGDGPTPHVHAQGLTQEERLPQPKISERAHQNDPKLVHPGKIMDVGGEKKVTPNSTYPYDDDEVPVDALHEAPGGDAQSNPREMRILLWHFGYNDAEDSDQGEGMPASNTTLGEFFDANPDIAEDPAQVQEIIDTLMAGRTYQENLGAGGLYGMKRIGTTNEDAMSGAVSAGNIGTGSPNALFTTKRVGEHTGSDLGGVDCKHCGAHFGGDATTADRQLADHIAKEHPDKMSAANQAYQPRKGQMVEFIRNGVPYRGRIVENHGRYLVVSTAGRRIMVETALASKSGDAEPTSHGPTRYGVKTRKQDHAQSSASNPNPVVRKFVGASEDIGDPAKGKPRMSFKTNPPGKSPSRPVVKKLRVMEIGGGPQDDDQSDGQQADPNQMELPGMQTPNRDITVDKITAPAYWASALINGDHSGLEDDESKQVEQFEQMLSKQGMSVINDVEGSERFTNSYHLYNYFGDPKIRGGDVLDYVVHVRPKEAVSEALWGDGPNPMFVQKVGELVQSMSNQGMTKGIKTKTSTSVRGVPGIEFIPDAGVDTRGLSRILSIYSMRNGWHIEKTEQGFLLTLADPVTL